jgi:hypothetical protein
LKAPEYFIGPVNGPFEGAIAEAILAKFAEDKVQFKDNEHLNQLVMMELNVVLATDKPTKSLNGKKVTIDNQIYGFQEYWLSYYDYFINECGLEIKNVEPFIELAKICGWWTPLANVAIIQHKPLEIHRDEQGRLHNPNGAAVKYRGKNSNSNVYAVHGVRVGQNVIERKYNVDDIDKEQNAEVRRVMIELYGQDRYIIDSKAELVHKDDFGELFRKELPGDEPLMMVKVVNSTPEQDGSYKDYWLRVDPNAYGGLKTAHAAVASTFRNNDAERSLMFKTPEEYNCDIET